MTPEKKKAKDLHLRFLLKLPFDKEVITKNEHGKWTYDSELLAKDHALACVYEILEELKLFNYKLTPLLSERIRFYQSVRKEIENL